ncbi:CPXCG motif-containing cysteine-rich protein [Flavobacteriaceae bacterium]|nr:CPXCG motif-containing cysteine-rich protein [Flavobacteriaceae bacterium]MDC1460620.1 CPXCG motif-containing cysteine-rich protein [Flavobacteriaceae bacterium]
MEEHFFQCPYCWEEISMLLEPSNQEQHYIEDCEVCCRPIQIQYSFEEELQSFSAQSLDD